MESFCLPKWSQVAARNGAETGRKGDFFQERSWGLFGAVLGYAGALLGPLGLPGAFLEPFRADLRALLGSSWALNRRSGPPLGVLLGLHEALGRHSHGLWVRSNRENGEKQKC